MGETLTRLEGATTTAHTRYEDDLYTWVEEQVALLRDGRIHELDLANIAEELQDVGSERYDQLESSFRVLLMHMLKWDQQPERKTASWEASIDEQRRRIERLLRKNPGLKSKLEEAILEGYSDARRWAAVETGLSRHAFPEECPYSRDDMMRRAFTLDPER